MTDKVEALLKAINKDAKDDVASLGVDLPEPPRLPSGVFPLDLGLNGGVPLGRCTVLYGPPSSMKSTLCLKWIAQAQRLYPKHKCVYVDAEGTFTKNWAQAMGVDTKALAFVQPQHAEQTVDVVTRLLDASDVSVIVLDSLAALVTQRELGSNAEDAMMGVSGILINKLYRKVTNKLVMARAQGRIPTPIFINQIRYKLGVLHGDPETQPGGPSFQFGASLALRVTGKDVFEDPTTGKKMPMPTFKLIRVHVKKWKVDVVARNMEFNIALRPDKKLRLEKGQSYDYRTVLAYLKNFERLVKGKAGWSVVDEHGEILAETKTLEALEHTITDDAATGAKVKAMITRLVVDSGHVIEAEE